MPRGVIDFAGLGSKEAQSMRALRPEKPLPFRIDKIGHVVLKVRDLERSAAFYTKVLGFQVTDFYPDTMMKGRMLFMRCNADHHGVALVGGADARVDPRASTFEPAAGSAAADTPAGGRELHHMAFAVGTLDQVFRAREHLKAHGVKIEFEGRRRAGCQVAVEFRDPDGHFLEIYWGLDQVGPDGRVRPPEEWRECFSLEEAVKDAPPGQDTALGGGMVAE